MKLELLKVRFPAKATSTTHAPDIPSNSSALGFADDGFLLILPFSSFLSFELLHVFKVHVKTPPFGLSLLFYIDKNKGMKINIFLSVCYFPGLHTYYLLLSSQ